MIKGSVQNIHKFYGVREKRATSTVALQKKSIKMDLNIYNLTKNTFDCHRLFPGGKRVEGSVYVTADMYFLIFKPRGWVGVEPAYVLRVDEILKLNNGFDNRDTYNEVMRRKDKPIFLTENQCLTIYEVKTDKEDSGMYLEFNSEDQKTTLKDVLKYLNSKKIGSSLVTQG